MSDRRTADWRLSPVRERELTEDRRRERRQRWNVLFLVAASVGLCPLACFGSCLTMVSGNGMTPLILMVTALTLFVVSLERYSNDGRKTRERRLARRQEFGDVAGWLVEMTVHQGDTISGRDVGVVWFEEDRLYFIGVRTSFGLGAGDAKGGIVEGYGVLDAGPSLVLPLGARSEVGPVAVGLRFVSPEPEAYALATSETAFRQALRAWLFSGKAKGQLPPLAAGPSLPSRATLQVRAVLATAVAPGLALLALASFLTNGALSVLALVPVALLLVLWTPATSPRRCWRAVRDRRRLDGVRIEP